MSELVNEAVRQSLAEDADDLLAIKQRSEEKAIPLEEAIEALRRDGKL